VKHALQELVAQAVRQLPDIATDDEWARRAPEIERTRDPQHGDFACNIAMQLARPLRKKPREIAEAVVAGLPASDLVKSVEIAGPGFINFRLSESAFHEELLRIRESGDRYGYSDIGGGRKVIVEYVSANPTGPLHVGHGRHAAYGATVSNLLSATGHDVHQEYYVNDAGRQMDILTASVWLRMLAHVGIDVSFPSSGYHGDYVKDIAAEAASSFDTSLRDEVVPDAADLAPDAPAGDADQHLDALIAHARQALGEENFHAILRVALDSILTDIRNDLAEFGVNPNEWFSEQSLMDSDAVERALKRIAEHGKSYEKEGATWFRATDYGDEKDRPVVRANGRTTYFASDIAYHLHKRERGFDLLLDILGADHHGYVARVRGGLEAMGEPPESLEVELVQFVSLFRGEEKIQMSTRSGQFVTLRELRDEVGNDAARLFFVMRSNEQHLDFDLELAKSKSNENPVYYIQYAHARVSSVMRELQTRGLSLDEQSARDSLSLLGESHEQTLLQSLSRYPEIVELSARQRAPQHLVHYLRDLAQDFHTYYNAHRFLDAEDALRNARLSLILATQQVIRNGLTLLGVSAPASM